MKNNLLLSKKFKCFCYTIKTFIFLMIYGDLINVKLFKTQSVVIAVSTAASSISSSSSSTLSIFMASRVGDNDNDVLTINNFDDNFFSNKNQIIFDTLQRKVHIDDNDLLSIEKCTRTTICGSSSNIAEAPQRLELTIATTDMITTTTAKMSMTNISTSSSPSPSPSSSSKLLSSSLSSSSLLQQRLLSRPKRYLSFPEGSSFSVAVCFTVGIIGNPAYNYMSFGLNWGVAYDLPNTSWILNHLHGFAKRPMPVAVWHRRSKRALYKEIENVVDNMGYNGRDCILRALCESRQYFQKTKMSMLGEMLRVMFSLPKQRIFSRELDANSDIELYDRAYRKARSVGDCSEQYECSFSLLELAFGKYSTAPKGYYDQH